MACKEGLLTLGKQEDSDREKVVKHMCLQQRKLYLPNGYLAKLYAVEGKW